MDKSKAAASDSAPEAMEVQGTGLTFEDLPSADLPADSGTTVGDEPAATAGKTEPEKEAAASDFEEPDWIDELFFGETDASSRSAPSPPQNYPPPAPGPPAAAVAGHDAGAPDPIQEALDSRLKQVLGPLVYEQYLMKQWLAREHQKRVVEQLALTANAVQQHIRQASSDPAMANPRVRKFFDHELKMFSEKARRHAEAGDFSLVEEMRSPLFRKMLLMGAKELAGYPDGAAPAPLKAKGMAMPNVRQVEAENIDFDAELGADFTAALRAAYGNGWTATAKKYIDAKKKYYGGDR